VGAYWVWLFPATMLNLYPWGLSVNVVQPLGPSRTRVRYLTLVADATLRGKGAGGNAACTTSTRCSRETSLTPDGRRIELGGRALTSYRRRS
jgi:hypothetical protein